CKILVVDDTPDFLKTLSGLLTDAGHTVRSAANEAQALAAVTQEQFDFALIDVRLHDGGEEDESGLSLAMAFRGLNPQIRVILLTRFVRTKQIVRAIRYHGVVDFIEKTPDVGKKILETIAEVRQEEAEWSRFEKTSDATRLSLSLTAGQPLVIRAHGCHVCSSRSWKVLRVALERYARRTELARGDVDNLRFQVGDIGRSLWHDIFIEHPEAEKSYVKARARSQSFSLLFETPREFLRLPLEFMRSEDPSEYLVLQHPLARFIYNATPKREPISPSILALTERLRILIIASNTTTDTLPPIKGVDVEAQELSKYLKRQDCIPVRVKFIPTKDATYERVRAELKKRSYDIIHYAGHGSYNAASPEESCLYFWADENKQGGVVPMQATELKMLLERSEARLVYLSSCYGTATGSEVALLDDDFLGLADAVAQAGVPSVLGFRWPVSDKGAPKLAQAFYQSLLEQGSPEVALWEARCELAALDRDDSTWLSPILIHQV
ncbi:CHAT domain-containing protein, partial [bacterium]|nr:CHAT domain-containing protein [bacterium]